MQWTRRSIVASSRVAAALAALSGVVDHDHGSLRRVVVLAVYADAHADAAPPAPAATGDKIGAISRQPRPHRRHHRRAADGRRPPISLDIRGHGRPHAHRRAHRRRRHGDRGRTSACRRSRAPTPATPTPSRSTDGRTPSAGGLREASCGRLAILLAARCARPPLAGLAARLARAAGSPGGARTTSATSRRGAAWPPTRRLPRLPRPGGPARRPRRHARHRQRALVRPRRRDGVREERRRDPRVDPRRPAAAAPRGEADEPAAGPADAGVAGPALAEREVGHARGLRRGRLRLRPAAGGRGGRRDAAARLGCFACHGPQGRGDTPNPRLAQGLHPVVERGGLPRAGARRRRDPRVGPRRRPATAARATRSRRSSCGARRSACRPSATT